MKADRPMRGIITPISLYKASFSYKFANIQSLSGQVNSVILPNTYKSMVSVWVNGNEISHREKLI